MTPDQVRGMLYGLAVGDALGVPYEFKGRGTFHCDGMAGHGTHDQPAGTWSDDTAMTLATLHSLIENGWNVDPADLLARYRNWLDAGAYTPDGEVFDCGLTCASAIRSGRGSTGERSQGNGSLMRIAPLAICHQSDEAVRAASAVTHAHPHVMDMCVRQVRLRGCAASAVPAHAPVPRLRRVLDRRAGSGRIRQAVTARLGGQKRRCGARRATQKWPRRLI